MFPIHNAKGSVIGFGGRVLSSQDNPKYLNSPETPLFSKSKELYGLYHCRKYSRRIDSILVVEGYMDVIALHQQGITNVVATLGTATRQLTCRFYLAQLKPLFFVLMEIKREEMQHGRL